MFARILDGTSKIFIAVAAGILCLFAIGLLLTAIWNLASGTFGADLSGVMLRSIGLTVIAVAVFDVGKFLLDEQIVRESEMRTVPEARRSLTKFMSIIIIAIFLEALVLVVETKFEEIEKIVYPALLLLVAIAAVVALGVFQRLAAAASATVPAEDSGHEQP
jgi:hypothetical protein